VVELGPAKALGAVTVLQAGDPARARVQVRSDGAWRTVGELTGAYAKLPTALTGDAVRLEWIGGGVAPRIAEIIAE
ncbi:hypothetical protein P8605_46325, partial [Streptomyces sp. T-3]|nr:hypothetical protein [Streptomyces sp. T-3]